MRALALAALLALAPVVAGAESPLPAPMTAAEFDAYATGKTLTYSQYGEIYGTEEYLPNRRVRWQAKLADAAPSALAVSRDGRRVAVGSTVVRVFDAATAIGLPESPTDFGETLHVWGVGEGVYVELPFGGPSTARDATGILVDLAINPVRLALPEREATAATIAKLFSRLGDRNRFSETVESVLYDSADSYAQARLLYLQNRRFQLGQVTEGTDAATDDGFIDPYEDPYAE